MHACCTSINCTCLSGSFRALREAYIQSKYIKLEFLSPLDIEPDQMGMVWASRTLLRSLHLLLVNYLGQMTMAQAVMPSCMWCTMEEEVNCIFADSRRRCMTALPPTIWRLHCDYWRRRLRSRSIGEMRPSTTEHPCMRHARRVCWAWRSSLFGYGVTWGFPASRLRAGICQAMCYLGATPMGQLWLLKHPFAYAQAGADSELADSTPGHLLPIDLAEAGGHEQVKQLLSGST